MKNKTSVKYVFPIKGHFKFGDQIRPQELTTKGSYRDYSREWNAGCVHPRIEFALAHGFVVRRKIQTS
jgi:hypothetical protein